MLRKTIITIAISAAISGALALAPVDAFARGGGGGGRTEQVLSAITTRLLQAFAVGPAGAAHPAADNLARLGIDHAVAQRPPPED